MSGTNFSDGDEVTLAKGAVVSTKSKRGGLSANLFDVTTWTDGLDVFAAKFRSVEFKAVATDGSTIVPGAEIEFYRNTQIPLFSNNTAQGVPYSDTLWIRVYLDGVKIADTGGRNVTIEADTNVITIETTWVAP